MKWFLALVVALNLLVGAFGALRQRVPLDVHAQEINAGQLKPLPADWQPPQAASAASVAVLVDASAPHSAAVASAPLAKLAASAPAVKLRVVPPATPKSKVIVAPVVAKPATVVAAKPAAAAAKGVAPVHKAVPVAKKEASPTQSKSEALKPKAETLAAAGSCAQWLGLSDSLLTRVQGGVAGLKLKAGQMSSSHAAGKAANGNVRFWVYYPEQANGAVAQALSTELKAKGFDNYMVQNDGEFKGALSLGLFGKEDAAQALIVRLKAAGYAKARVDPRGSKSQVTNLNFSGLSATQSAELVRLQQRLTPGITLKHAACGK
jgi:hypothetical protein